MLFKKEILQELDWETPEGYEVILSDHDPDKHRWYTIYTMIFKFEEKFYGTFYKVGNTECQEVDRYEYEPDEIECKEVFRREKIIVEYS